MNRDQDSIVEQRRLGLWRNVENLRGVFHCTFLEKDKINHQSQRYPYCCNQPGTRIKVELINGQKQVQTNPVRYVYEITDSFGVALCGILGELINWERRVQDESNKLNVTKIDIES